MQSTFAISLWQALNLDSDHLVAYPAHAAQIAVEGALEDPSKAAEIFDRLSAAYNAKGNPRAIADLRFALAREKATAQSSAPKRWAMVLKAIS
jgi:hypothetical protein